MKIKVQSSLYPSCCYYGLKQTGLLPGEISPKFLDIGKEFSSLGQSFSFQAPMAGGPIFSFVYQMPGYLDATKAELPLVFDAVKYFIEHGSIEMFQSNWPLKTRYWDLWYTEPWVQYLHNGVKNNSTRALELINKFLLFLQDIWSDYQTIHHDKLKNYDFAKYEQICNSINVFDKWEVELQQCYPYSNFSIIICPESNTSASSLGPEKIIFSSHRTIEQMINSLVHEIGVRMINLHTLATHQATKDIMLNDYHRILMLIETEVCFRKPHILTELTDDLFIDGMKLSELVAWRAGKQMKNSVAESFAEWYEEVKIAGLL